MAKVEIVGIRHHSPACSRLVAHVIARARPKLVLVEGPLDMNERIDELLLPHEMPIALFSYRQNPDGSSRGTWTPFCDFSPELVAMKKAKEVGAVAKFMDLPAWDDAFEGVENRFGTRRHSDAVGEIADSLGFEDTDALWDHLFEQPKSEAALESELSRYFDVLRADEPAGARDAPREKVMAEHIAAAARDVGENDAIVVVCGGFHKPALERESRGAKAEWPGVPALPDGARAGSYFVPYSLRRLDSFAGYASGMPSPGFYQAVWEEGPERAAEKMLFFAIQHLRKKKQRVSPADAIAASSLAHGLRAIRAHEVLARIDVLDGLAGALVKEALDAPLPWTRRGVLARHTDALLVELVSAFSGQKIGVLAKGTPAPPLVHDAFDELGRVGVSAERSAKKVTAKMTEPEGIARSHVLHRFRVLEIPGFQRTRAPSFTRQKTELTEEWSVERVLETDPALVEAAAYGGSLLAAARAKLEERTRGQADVARIADALYDAALCGIAALASRWLSELSARIAHEPSLAALGAATAKLLHLYRDDIFEEMRASPELGRVLAALWNRGLWLFEGMRGENAPFVDAEVYAVRALRDLLRHGPPEVKAERGRGHAVCTRRVTDDGAPPALRGAALGMKWSTTDPAPSAEHGSGGLGEDEERAVAALRAAWRPEVAGDYLAGLFVLAREEVARSKSLLAAIDAALASMLREDFFVALPSMRLAFSFFPPQEKLRIAEALLARDGAGPHHATALLHLDVSAADIQRGARIDRAAADLAKRFGLGDVETGGKP
jgi:hypothetical protein